jgi:hypothetical protein
MPSLRRQSSTKPQHEYVFFTDRDLGKIVPNALEQAGVRVERHDSHFPPTTPDVAWLAAVGERGWIALTHNRRLRYVAVERDMVMRARVALFCLIGDVPHQELAANVVRTLDRIIAFREAHSPPFIAKVYRPSPRGSVKPGHVTLDLSLSQWKSAGGK